MNARDKAQAARMIEAACAPLRATITELATRLREIEKVWGPSRLDRMVSSPQSRAKLDMGGGVVGELLDAKTLADKLGKGRTYVSAMCAAGFPMIARRATMKSALDWLENHPDFRVRDGFPDSVNKRERS